MKYKPYDYQQYATQWILDKEKAGLLLDMGMGKSVITLTAIDELMFNYFEVSKVLVIAPLRVAESNGMKKQLNGNHLEHLKYQRF